MKTSFFLLLIFCLFVIGALTYCFMNTIIIIKNLNAPYTEHRITESFRAQKKKIVLFFFKNGSFNQENEYIILTPDKQENSMMLINRWLTILADESITPFRVSLQSTTYDQSGKKLIISCEQSFLSSHDSVWKKLMHIESLLKTIRENTDGVQEVYFLVHHKPLNDPHLDTARAWPINGFTQSS